mmetsp:Transcript_1148/g.2229  ORF Transcript_1148/g.2229 Transcript_1148/m.2229 type:complete len:431 (+) Transcript_1148:68-1360(+)
MASVPALLLLTLAAGVHAENPSLRRLQVTCAGFEQWPSIDNDVTCDNCRALVLTSPYGGRCDLYCQSFGHTCVAAAEEKNENCVVKQTHRCDEEIPNTSDMLCTCQAASGPVATTSSITCTPNDSDPWVTGSKVPCCSTLQECLGDHTGSGNWFYKCLASCMGEPATSAPTVTPGSGDNGVAWQPSGAVAGSGWCAGQIPIGGWDLRKSCSGGTQVKVLSYNLFWWNLFGQRGGNGGSAGRLIARNGPFDIMAFQECDDVWRVLGDAGLSSSHEVSVANHATAIAYEKNIWQELASGSEDVAEDNRFQYYGRRGVGWVRLLHKTSGKVVFVVNHHGPLQVNTGGKCGMEATAYNMLKVIGQHAQTSDASVLLGDLNADRNSATQSTLRNYLYQAAHDWVDAIFGSCQAISSQNLGNGGSDHNAIEAVFDI